MSGEIVGRLAVGRCMNAKLVSRYLDGDLGPDAEREFEDHVASCAMCRGLLQEMQEMDEAVRLSAEVPEDVPDVSDRVVAELKHRGAFVRARVAPAGGRSSAVAC